MKYFISFSTCISGVASPVPNNIILKLDKKFESDEDIKMIETILTNKLSENYPDSFFSVIIQNIIPLPI